MTVQARVPAPGTADRSGDPGLCSEAASWSEGYQHPAFPAMSPSRALGPEGQCVSADTSQCRWVPGTPSHLPLPI